MGGVEAGGWRPAKEEEEEGGKGKGKGEREPTTVSSRSFLFLTYGWLCLRAAAPYPVSMHSTPKQSTEPGLQKLELQTREEDVQRTGAGRTKRI